MSEKTFTQGDTAPPITATIKNSEDNAAQDLTNVTEIRFQMRKPDDRRFTVDEVATITDAMTGRVRYSWGVHDLDVPGDYQSQWELHWNDGKIQTTDPPNTITVRRQ